MKDKLGKILIGASEKILTKFDHYCIDLIVMSPPYDGANMPKGYKLDLVKIGKLCYDVLVDGGVLAYVTQDVVKGGKKSLTSFKTAINWCDEVGFNFWGDFVYYRGGAEGYWWKKRLRIDHDYIFIFVKKSTQPRVFDKTHMGKSGTVLDYRRDKKQQNRSGLLGKLGVVPFPGRLAADMIKMFSKEKDIVLDPFVGTGTTVVEAKRLKRQFIGIELQNDIALYAQNQLKKVNMEFGI